MNYTKGEWRVEQDDFGTEIISDQTNPDDTVNIAEVDSYKEDDNEVRANAQLIAAAPAMYEALRVIKWYLDEPNKVTLQRVQERVAEALVKADGVNTEVTP